MSGLILVTGATGKTGVGLVKRLQHAGAPYRAASRHQSPPFDWAEPATWSAAMENVGSVYLIAPPTVNNPYDLMQSFAASAVRAGARRFVFLSMAGLPAGGPAHGQVHQWLKDNCDDWAVLCASAFMQNFSQGHNLAAIREDDQIYSNTGTGRVPFIDADDIAAAAFAALTAPKALNTEFVLTGEQSLSYDRVAELISHACGRRISHTHVSNEEMGDRLIKRGLPEATARFLAFGYATIAAGMADRITDDVQRLTGKAPTTFESFAEGEPDVWRRAE